jgi:hypothetical protein
MVYCRVNVTVLLFPSRCFSSGKFLLQFYLFIYILPYLYFIHVILRSLHFHSNEQHVYAVLTATCGEITTSILQIYRNNQGKTLNFHVNYSIPVPVAARSMAWVCGRSLAGIVGSNPAGGMIVCLF